MGKDVLLYIYILEIVPKKYKVFVAAYGSTLFSGISNVTVSLYFYLGGKHWKVAC